MANIPQCWFDGKLMVIAGKDDSDWETATVEVYDAATSSWSTVSSLSRARYGHASVVLPDGRVLVTGGNGGGSNLSSTELGTYISSSNALVLAAWGEYEYRQAVLCPGLP